MRQLFVSGLFLVAVVFATGVEPPKDIEPFGYFEDLINSTIESIRPDLPDPLVIEDLNITLPDDAEELLQGSATLTDLQLTGIKGFQITALALQGLTTLNFTVVLPVINLNTNYWGDLTVLSLVPLYGSGQANIHLVDVEIVGTAGIDLSGGLSIKNLRIQLALGSSTFDIHGALDDENFSAILSQLLNDVVTTFVDDHQEVISNIISPIIEAILNAILAGAPTTVAPTN